MDPTYESLADFIGGPPGAIARRGLGKAQVEIMSVRSLGEGDLSALASGAIGSTTPQLTKLRSPHHNMARLLAEGVKAVQVSAITGYSQSRISILRNDPAFQELVAYYQTQAAQVYVDVHTRLAELGTVGIEVLQERLDEQPESFGNRELLSLVEMTMDRSVAPAKGGAKAQGGSPQAAPAITVNFVQVASAEGGTASEVTVALDGQSQTLNLPSS